MALPSASNTRWPIAVFNTIRAKTICRLRPHVTVVQLIARRFFENATAIARITTAPNIGCRMPGISEPLPRSEGRAPAARRRW